VVTASKECDKIIESSYYNHYVAHAPMENHAVLVDIAEDEVRIWASTQTPFRVRSTASETLGIAEEKIRVMPPFIGGGFGGKKSGLDIVQACRLAEITGRPVQVSLSRQEEFFYDHFRPASVIQSKSGVDADGRIRFWDFCHLYSGTRSSEPIYDIPDLRVVYKSSRGGESGGHPFATGAWRGPGSNSNVHAMESQVDMMAESAGMDPLSFRLRNLTDKRLRNVLEAAADKFGKSFSVAPSGKGYGIACTDYLNTCVATMAELKVDNQSGAVEVSRIVCAQDMGEIINPQGARLQIEGGITMGLGYCLGEEIQFQGSKVLTTNFDTYDITRISWSPEIDVVLLDNPDVPPQGCGEPAITTMGAVIANAVYDATGIRLFTLPMTPARIRDAVRKS
jgi:isoquinoline 1-oxidoreductase